MDQPIKMRKADFWTSLVFFGVALAMIGSALTMPLKESFAGVQNAWYVSPALLPLVLACCLLVLATALFVNAIRSGGAAAALAALGGRSQADRTPGVRMLTAILIIVGYVYGLIPRVDYFVATALFLLAFIGGFYLKRWDIMRLLTAGFLGLAGPAFLADLVGRYPAPGSMVRYALDGVALAVFVGLSLATRLALGADGPGRRRLAITVAVSLVVSFLTSVAFKFGLLVPLPAEGAIIRVLEAIEIALRPLWA